MLRNVVLSVDVVVFLEHYWLCQFVLAHPSLSPSTLAGRTGPASCVFWLVGNGGQKDGRSSVSYLLWFAVEKLNILKLFCVLKIITLSVGYALRLQDSCGEEAGNAGRNH